jgi:hypothetical protein
MLARTSIIKHPCGLELQTPMLVSSFSSKGFLFVKENDKMKSQSVELLRETAEYLNETVLLSAYDLKYFFPKPEKLRGYGFFPQVVFLDSGGYETIDDYDFSESYKHPVMKRKWSPTLHMKVLNNWPKYYPAIIISYDNGNERRKPLKQQIDRANNLFSKYPNQLNDFLVKPEKKGDKINIPEVVDNISLLKKFHIIGITEKELGGSIIERMHNIMTIRASLNKIDCNSPIHIFGNLDPLTSALYFISGAEIFDGLTWLRFAFHEGKSIYLQNIDALKGRIHEKDYLNYKTSHFENLIYMRNLQSQMKSFLKVFHQQPGKEAFNCFQYIGGDVYTAYQAMTSK